jgi:probable HAF family extracellular repeat protein
MKDMGSQTTECPAGASAACGSTIAYSLNDKGQVTGTSSLASTDHAFLWQDGRFTDLNDLIPTGSGWELGAAGDINNSGLILGSGTYHGEDHAFLLTPKPTADADIQLSQSSFSFGEHAIGQTSEPGAIWIHNTGPDEVSFARILFTGGAAGDFAITENTCGATLAPDASCSVTFRFKPAAQGERQASLLFNDNARNSPQTAAVVGTGIASQLQFSRLSWQFPTRLVGETSGEYVVYVYNNGKAAVQFTSIQFSGGDTGDFAVTKNTCGSALAPYTTCGVAFHFAPTANGERKTSLLFNGDSNGTPQIVSVSGFGSRPTLNFSRLSWQFPTRSIGETSESYVAYLYNPSAQPVHFASIQLAGGNVQDFAITGNTCGAALAPYTTCGVAFHFAPTAVGERSTSLVFNDTSYGSPQVVSMTGYAVSK